MAARRRARLSEGAHEQENTGESPRSPARTARLTVRSKIWIENQDGSVVFGAGRLQILNAIELHGSILAAAKELGMSYRAVWGKIRATEKTLGQPLLARRTGGVHGGGSELTPLGKDLVERFQKLQHLIETTADTLFEGLFTGEVTHQVAALSKEK